MSEVIGTLLNDRYRLDVELGRGGMGAVYRARDTLLERDVAVKVLAQIGLGTEGRARMLREARSAAQLNHPNIVSIYDAGEDAGTSFIVMELVEHQTLFESKPDSLAEILSITRQMCDALEHAHAHGIVHRDLKPENVIVIPDGTAKLTDFGLARSVASRISVEGAISGTVFYLPPEQALGQEIDGRADLYALGVMLYELVAGRLPFTADDPLAVISQHLHAPVVPPSTYNAEIPPALDALIVQMLSKRPQDRPASAVAVRQVLDRLSKPEDAAVQATLSKRRKLSPLDQLVCGRLVGREREFAAAKALWKQAMTAAGEERVLLISGEPGIGKTPLVREIRALTKVLGGQALTGECYAEGSAPYAPIAQIIRDALSLPGLDLPDLVLADLITLAPDLQAHYPDVPPNLPLDPQAEQQRLFESMVALCSALTERTPLLLVVEDVQWANGGTLFLLRHLARRSRSAKLRLLIVLTYRELELDQACCLSDVLLDLNRERLAVRIKLARLDREQTRDLLAVMLQDEITDEFLEGIYRETEGNPFFIEEICKALIEEGQLYRDNGHWHRPDMRAIQLPQSVRMVVQSRVGKLPAQVQDVLRLAAIVGREFDFDTLQQACELDEEALIDALEIAERAQLIGEVRPAGQETFAFAHGLTRTTLRESVSGLRRRRLHRRIATAIAALHPDDFETLAYHYEQAGDTERAQTYYTRASERALAVYANKEAEQYHHAALELSESDSDRAHLLSELGEALFRQSRYAEARQTWREAIDLYQAGDDYDNTARLYARAARAAWYAGDVPGGLALCRAGMAAIPDQLETPGTAALVHETARAYYFNELPGEALPLCEQALAMAQRLGLAEVQADTLATLGVLPNQSFEAQLQALTRAVEIAESAGLLATAARAHYNLAGRLHKRGDFIPARDHYLRARELAQQMGIVSWEHDFLHKATGVALELGDLEVAEEELSTLQQLLNAIPDPDQAALHTSVAKASFLRRRGEWPEAIRLMQANLAEARRRDYHKLLTSINNTLGDTLLEVGQLDQAEQALVEARQSVDKCAEMGGVESSCLLSAVRIRQGRIEEARRLLNQARESIDPQSAPQNKGLVQWTEARLAAATRRWPEALASFEGLARLVTELGARWHLAYILQEWAEVHFARGEPGDPARAQELLRDALAIFEQLPAPGYVALVEERLRATAHESVP